MLTRKRTLLCNIIKYKKDSSFRSLQINQVRVIVPGDNEYPRNNVHTNQQKFAYSRTLGPANLNVSQRLMKHFN